jgi:glucans biosynthesis protein
MAHGRREFLKLALGGAVAVAASSLEAAAASAESLAGPTPFSPDSVLQMARELAKSPYKAPAAALPEIFANLNFEQYAAIRRQPGSAIWSDEKLGFALEPLHRGFVYRTPINLHVVENGEARRVIYDASAFDFGKLTVPPRLGDVGFSGLRVLKSSESGFQDVAIFQGATFFRSLARGQFFGVTARGLAIRTGDEPGEEFPLFRDLWIEKPAPAADTLVLHALLDSASLTGAFRFTLRPLEATIIDTELTLVARVAIDKLGMGAMAASYAFGALDHRRPDDIRPDVYEVTGLQMLSGQNEWLWRPVSNRETLQISSFADANPKGFGLLQRSRAFDIFGDDDAHWELRPSLWIEPIGDWGEGEVHLLEIPSDSEVNDNVVAQWRPKAGLAAGATLSFAYRQFWCWTPPARPSLAACVDSRTGKAGKRRRFLVEMAGDIFADPQKSAAASADIHTSKGQIVSTRLFAYKERRSVRVVFDLDPGSETYAEIRLSLRVGDQPASETWLYRWTA